MTTPELGSRGTALAVDVERRGQILQLLRGAGVDFDPCHVLKDGSGDTPEKAAKRMLGIGSFNNQPEVIEKLGNLGIGV